MRPVPANLAPAALLGVLLLAVVLLVGEPEVALPRWAPGAETTRACLEPAAVVDGALLREAQDPGVEESAAPAEPGPPSGRLASVSVRDEHGVPVVGAEVFGAIAMPRTLPANTTLPIDPLAVDLHAPLRAVGKVVRTDAQGQCAVPLRAARWLVAQTRDRYGAIPVLHRPSAAAGHFEVVVHPDRTLVVHTVDERGAEVGAVALAFEREVTGGRGVQKAPLLCWLAATDAAGRLVIPHVQRWQRGGTGHRTRLRALIPGAASAAVSVDLCAPSTGSVDLVVPATGSLLVEVTGPDRLPLPDAEVEVLGLERGRTDAAGQCVFTRVAADGNLQIRASSPGRTASVACRGPGVGRRVTARVPLVEAVVQLSGQLVNAEGRPRRPSTLQLHEVGPGGLGATALSQADGRFVFLLPGSSAGHLLAQARIELLTADHHLLGERVQLRPITLQLGDNPLGALQLAPATSLVAGTITGQPEPASCSFRLEVEGADGWRAQEDFEVTSGPAGTFALRGPDPSRPMRLFCSVRGFATAGPFRFVAGAQGLAITPELGGSLEVRLPVGRPRALRLVRAGSLDGELAMMPTIKLTGGNATCQWPCLPQGAYRLEVLSPQGGLVEFLVPDIYVFPGARVDDPRLVPELQLPG